MKSRIQVGLIAAICAAIVALGVMIWMDRMTPVTIAISPMQDQEMQVSVSGAVATPGIVQVPAGSRLQHVVDAAGGFLPDADISNLNLAGHVADGEQVRIPWTNRPEADPPVTGTEVIDADSLIDINTATAEELQSLPGIGDVLSVRIVEYRELHGPFGSVDDLQNVDGISARMVDELRPLVTVSQGG